MKTYSPAEGKTRNLIVQALKTEGAMTSAQLAQRLNLTAMAVRQHLYALKAEGLISVEERPVPIGRPVKYWQLTPAADKLFPNAYAELNLSLLTSVEKAFGPEGIDKVLDLRGERQHAAYVEKIDLASPLKNKLQQLANLRTQEGYMAEVQPDITGGFLFFENHCPICVAATEHRRFCSVELDVFRRILGPDVEIERFEHIVSGARRCAYRIKAASEG